MQLSERLKKRYMLQMNNYSTYIILFFSFFTVRCETTPTCDCVTNNHCESGECVTDENNGNVNNGTTPNNETIITACTTSSQCSTNEICEGGVCRCDVDTHQCANRCVSDNDLASCGKRCEPCDAVKNGTPTCQEATCVFTCDEGFRVCDTNAGCPFENGSCISCENNAECLDPKNPTCSEGTCVSCIADNDCPIEKPVCSNGSCEVCSASNENACGGKTCDPATSECTDVGFEEQKECEACVADSQCETGLFCVPMVFKDTPINGGFCLKGSDLNGCPAPFPNVLIDRVSLSGRPADRYCGPDENLTTCTAVLAYNDDCGADDECGLENVADAVCAPVEFEFAKCSFPCSDSQQCPSDFSGCWRDIDKEWWCGGF